MRVLRYFPLLPISFILSYGLVISANNFQLFSYTRFARLAMYLTPVIFFAVLLLHSRFPPPKGWTRAKSFRREAIWVAGFAIVASLALTPVYEGLGRYFVTLAVVLSALFIWGTVSALPALSGETRHSTHPQVDQTTYEKSEPYSWKKYYIEKILLAFFILTGAAGMGVFLYMALFVRMYGDDWCYHKQALVQGVFVASIDFYQTWSGRFFSNFLLFAGAGNRWTPVIQMILVIASIFTCSYLTLSASPFGARQVKSYRLLRILWSIACGLFIPFIIFSITPDPYKSLYWIVSSVVVLPFMILIPVYLAFAKALLARNRSKEVSPISQARAVSYTVFGFVLGFMLSTIHEAATVPVMILSGSLMFLALYSKSRRTDFNGRFATMILGIALAGSLLGFIVTYFSPGNATRHILQGYPQPPDLPTLLRLNTYYFLRYLSRISLGTIPFSKSGVRELGGIEWFALITAFLLGYLGAKFGRSWWNPLIVMATTLVMSWACFLPGVYAAQVEIPMRAELIPTSILVFGLFTAGFLSPKLSPSYLSTAILSIMLLLNAFFIRDLFTMQVTLVKPIVKYAGEWDVRNTRLLTSDDAVYLLKPPWDEKEQGKCIIDYYDYLRKDW